ncbi:hypothetical protein [Sphingobacterium siyangense]|uniref:hypothetical protein n=1 Tax=Sphingobacterium siyangense TaxID=459529 RepID=UPI002FDD07C7
MEPLSREQLKGIQGGKTPPYRCELLNGMVVDCYQDNVSRCIDILDSAGATVGGCWSTTPLPDPETAV